MAKNNEHPLIDMDFAGLKIESCGPPQPTPAMHVRLPLDKAQVEKVIFDLQQGRNVISIETDGIGNTAVSLTKE